MRRFNLGYHIRQGLHGVASHGFMTVASIGIMASCLLIMGTFALLAINLEYNLDALMQENEFLAYVDDTYTDEQAEALGSQIEAIDNVASCDYITRDEAWESYTEGLNDSSLYEDLPSSVLRGRFSITVNDIEQLQDTIDQVRGIEGIADISAALEVANGFITLRNVTSNAIKLATSAREGEIAIMKMVGATNTFVRLPFVVEGIILGVGSAVVAYLAEWGLYELLTQAINVYSHIQLVNIIPFEELRIPLMIIFGGIGLIVGVVGSVFTIRKFLRV